MELDFFNSFTDFMTEMQETFPAFKDQFEAFEDSIMQNENKNEAVNIVLAPFRTFSRDILIHDPEMFLNPLVCLGDVDLSNLFNNTDVNTQFAIWQYLETLYISGNVYLKPHKKTQFLQTVWKIKSKYALPNLPAQGVDDDAITQATNQLQGLFGGNGGVMGDLLGDVAKTVGNVLKNNDPAAVLQSMMSGDMSAFGNVFDDMDKKYGDRLQKEPVDTGAFMQNATQMLSSVGGAGGAAGAGGFNPMSMLQGMMGGSTGATQPVPLGDEDESAGGMDPMAMMKMMQRMMGGQQRAPAAPTPRAPVIQQSAARPRTQQAPPRELDNPCRVPNVVEFRNEVHDVSKSPYFGAANTNVEDSKDTPSDSDN